MMLTHTLARDRSAAVSTSVIVTKPMRGSVNVTLERLTDFLAQDLVDFDRFRCVI